MAHVNVTDQWIEHQINDTMTDQEINDLIASSGMPGFAAYEIWRAGDGRVLLRCNFNGNPAEVTVPNDGYLRIAYSNVTNRASAYTASTVTLANDPEFIELTD